MQCAREPVSLGMRSVRVVLLLLVVVVLLLVVVVLLLAIVHLLFVLWLKDLRGTKKMSRCQCMGKEDYVCVRLTLKEHLSSGPTIIRAAALSNVPQ